MLRLISWSYATMPQWKMIREDGDPKLAIPLPNSNMLGAEG